FAAQSVTLAGNSDAAGIVLVNATALTGTNAVTVDVSGRANAITVNGGAGADVMIGSAAADTFNGNAGNDSLRFANANFGAGDALDGGTGTDEIRITTAATLTDAQFANKLNIENLVLAADANGQSVTLGTNSQTTGITAVDASLVVTGANSVTLDASGRTTAITLTGGAGADVLIAGSALDTLNGGAGNDSLRFTNANFAANDIVNGGTGTDEIRITTAATITDAQFANKSAVETIALGADAGGQTVTLGLSSQTA